MRTGARPGLLLPVALALVALVDGVAWSFLYPRGAALVWIPSFLLGGTTTGALMSLAARRRGAGVLVAMAALGVGTTLLAAVTAANARAILLLARHDTPRSWSTLLHPESWWRLHERVVAIPLCCTRSGGDFAASTDWTFLASELGSHVAGALFVAAFLLRRRRATGGLPA